MNVLKSVHTGVRGGVKYIYSYKQTELQKNSIIFGKYKPQNFANIKNFFI